MFQSLVSSPRLLLVRLRSLGDVVLMTPLLESIQQERPDAWIDVLVEHPFSEILYDNPFIHRLIEIRSGEGEGRAPLPDEVAGGRLVFFSRLKAAWFLRRTSYAVAWNLHGGSTSAWLTRFSGARYRIGGEQFRNHFVYNVLVPTSVKILGRKSHHTVESTLAWFDWLRGGHRSDFSDAPPLKVVVDPETRRRAHEKLRAAGLNPQGRYVVVQPAAVFETKEWMADRFATVIDSIQGMGYQVVLTGTSTERTKLEAVKDRARGSVGILTELSIRELAAVIGDSGLYLGNDSGPAHLAAALKKPTVVLFGSSNSTAWGPWQTRSAIVQNYFECNPCPGYSCGRFPAPECIRSITVEQVKTAIHSLLSESH